MYTPVEIVDFILRAADDVSKKHFGRGLTDEGTCILDPFAGTSTFMVRLLQSGLIEPEDLPRKYAKELYATEIMLLAYYVSAANIETTFNALQAEGALRREEPAPDYVPFTNIALADTFQIHEDGDIEDLNVFAVNNDTIERQKKAKINVIIGNPPYSAGQSSANDLNANLKYPSLDEKIAETYAGRSTAQLKNSLYDSYLRAFRWATDRIKKQGVVAFVSNGGWLDGNTGDGVRLSMAEDFTDLYVFNLRGNQRTAGEQSRREGGKVFGSGSRNTVAITIGIKDPSKQGFTLHYRDIGDYLSAEEKLDIVKANTIDTIEWQSITPNEYGDWLGQRDPDFDTWPTVGSNKRQKVPQFFRLTTHGTGTSRDAWLINSNQTVVATSVTRMLQNYNSTVATIKNTPITNEREVTEYLRGSPELSDTTLMSWSRGLRQRAARKEYIASTPSLANTLYRPFFAQHCWHQREIIEVPGKLTHVFPTPKHRNSGIVVTGPATHYEFGVLATDLLPNLHTLDTGQYFPRFTWESVEAEDGGLFGGGAVVKHGGEVSVYGEIGEVVDGYVRVDNVTDEIRTIYRDALGADITGDDIFHFVYGKLHDPAYRETYAADLKKMLPHIKTPETREEFDTFAAAGAELMALHVGYEDVEPWPLDIRVRAGIDESDRETWRVLKMRWAKRKDPETGKNVNDVTKLLYNKHVTISGIPEEADEYLLGSRSAVAWLIDRYQVKKDKASGIVNDPNDWADEVGNPRYIVDLIGKVTRVAMETVRIVDSLRPSEGA